MRVRDLERSLNVRSELQDLFTDTRQRDHVLATQPLSEVFCLRALAYPTRREGVVFEVQPLQALDAGLQLDDERLTRGGDVLAEHGRRTQTLRGVSEVSD